MFSRKLVAMLTCIAVLCLCGESFARWGLFGSRGHQQQSHQSKACKNCSSSGQECSGKSCELKQTFGDRVSERREARKSAQVDKWLTQQVFAKAETAQSKLVALAFTDEATCEHCRDMKKTLHEEKIQAQLKTEGITLVDCDTSQTPHNVFQQCEINRVPTLILGTLDDKGKLSVLKRIDEAIGADALSKFIELPKEEKATPVEHVGG